MSALARAAAIAALTLAPSLGCSSSPTTTGAPAADAGVDASAEPTRGDFDPTPFGGDRPALLYVPTSYDDAKPAPLLVLLHGYSASGAAQDLYLGLKKHAESRGFLYIYPDGTIDKTGNRFWNATDACCDFGGTKVDDSTYVSKLIAEVGARYRVDPKRVFLFGHSNGAFMSFRMACDHGDQIAAIGALAGSTWADASKCKPSAPVSVLQIHGTADTSVLYEGSSAPSAAEPGVYPGAKDTAKLWAGYDGCASTPETPATAYDLDTSLPGAETTTLRYGACKSASAVELWSIAGGKHLPSFGKDFAPMMLDWLFAHPKP